MQVYDEAMQLPECEAVHLTRIHWEYECDTSFPRLPDSFSLWSAAPPQRDNQDWIEFLCYTRSDAPDGPPQLPAGIASQHEERQVDTTLPNSITAASPCTCSSQFEPVYSNLCRASCCDVKPRCTSSLQQLWSALTTACTLCQRSTLTW